MLGRQLLRTSVGRSRRTIVNKPSSSPTRACLHGSPYLQAISPLRMPALSPTMEAGQISKWSVKTGERFSAGDVLLTIETDKAEVDVEAQDDGFMGPQLFGPGSSSSATRKSISVGEVIAVLGEQADDVQGAVDVPPEWNAQTTAASSAHEDSPASSPKAQQDSSSSANQSQAHPPGRVPRSILPLSPAVSRLLHEMGVKDATKIKGTGLRGRLTKGDVLTHFKKASCPSGTAQKMIQADAEARLAERSKLGSSSASKAAQIQDLPPLDASAVRLYITEGLAALAKPSSTPFTAASFDSLLDDYSAPSSSVQAPRSRARAPPSATGSHDTYFEGFV